MRFLTFLIVLIFTANLMADNARVKYLIGDVRVKQVSTSQGWKALDMKTALLEKDVVRTGTEALCEIELPDGSVSKILENSILELRNFPDPADENIDLFSGIGKFFFKVKKTLSRKFQVSSPVAVAAIRGTEFLVINDGDKTEIRVQEGQVDLSDTYMRKTVQIKAGYKSQLSAGNLPSEPIALTNAEKKELKEISKSSKPELEKPTTPKSIETNDSLIPPSKKADDTSGESAPEKPSSSSSSSGGNSFAAGAVVGVATLDNQLYNQIGIRPEFSIGKLGVALDLSIYIDNEGNISDENWNSFNDIIEKIYYVRWGQRNDPLYVKVGAIDDYRLGFGLLMNHYANTVEYPDVIRTGVEFGLKRDKWGVDLMLNNINELLNSGGLMAGRYSYNLLGGLQVGASMVYDRNQYRGLKDRDGDDVPDFADFAPDDKYAAVDTDGDGIADAYDPDRDQDYFFDNPDVVPADVQSDTNRFDANFDESTLKKPFKIGEAKDASQLAVAFDISYPLVNFDYLKLITYGQYANYPMSDGAWGITAPGFLAKFAFINAFAEYRIFSSGFLPEYFNRTYELERAIVIGDSAVTKADRLSDVKESLQGFVIGADFDILNFITFGAEYQNMSSDSYHLRTFRSSLDLNTSFIPRINRAGAYYMQDNAVKLFKRTEGTILGYRFEYEIAGGASLLLDFRQTYRDLNGDGKLEPVRSTNIQTVMRF